MYCVCVAPAGIRQGQRASKSVRKEVARSGRIGAAENFIHPQPGDQIGGWHPADQFLHRVNAVVKETGACSAYRLRSGAGRMRRTGNSPWLRR